MNKVTTLSDISEIFFDHVTCQIGFVRWPLLPMLLGGFCERILSCFEQPQKENQIRREQSRRLRDPGECADRSRVRWLRAGFPSAGSRQVCRRAYRAYIGPTQEPARPCGPDTALLLATSLVPLPWPPGCWRCLSPSSPPMPRGRMAMSQYGGCRARLHTRAPISCPVWLRGSGQQVFFSTWEMSSRSNLVIWSLRIWRWD